MINLKKLPNQKRDEKTILFLRRHWIEILEIIGYAIVLTAFPMLLLYLFQLTGAEITTHVVWGPIVGVFLGMYFYIVLIIIMTQFTDYYLDTWIVTTERIFNIEQHGLFSRIVSELHLNQIQDITAETNGFLATMLTFGDVYIQTAGTRERFNFKGINDPEKVKKTIARLVEEDKRRHGDNSQPGVPLAE